MLRKTITLLLAWGICSACLLAQPIDDAAFLEKLDREVYALMKEGDIPGLSLAIVAGEEELIRTYGLADVAENRPVEANTLFELGSCSKAFTALAVLNMVQDGQLSLDDFVSDYIPWFKMYYQDSLVHISIRQLLHHTSGIPWHTISKIPVSQAEDALENTVHQLLNQDLEHLPGEVYEYATMNYDVLALIIQKIAGRSFEEYLKEQVIDPLNLTHTTIGVPANNQLMSKGYKTSFFHPREYEAPRFKGNNAAGYVISDIRDMSKWLRFHLGQTDSTLFALAQQTHQRDRTVSLHGLRSYAMGWEILLDGSGQILHEGLNPNFSSYTSFVPDQEYGLVILTNANSSFTPVLGKYVMSMLAGEDVQKEIDPSNGADVTFSLASIGIATYVLLVFIFLSVFLVQVFRKVRTYEKPGLAVFGRMLKLLLQLSPFVLGIYLLPMAIANFSWASMAIWVPSSFIVMIWLLGAAITLSFITFCLTLLFPEKNQYKRMAPQILLISVLMGVAAVAMIVIITSSFNSNIHFGYILFYFMLVVGLNLFGLSFVQKSLIRFTKGLVYDLRIQMVGKIFSTSFERFEKMGRGRVYTTMNNDISTIGNASSMVVTLVSSLISAVGSFIYLAALDFWATLVTILLFMVLIVIGFYIDGKTRPYFEAARDEQNVFMRLLSGMIDGFKELSLHRSKKLAYKDDIAVSADAYRNKSMIADIKAVDGFILGQFMLIAILGGAALGIPVLFPNIKLYTVISFVMVLLYLIGPIGNLLSTVPQITHLKVIWNRVQQFIKDIPSNIDLNADPTPPDPVVKSLVVRNLTFEYKNEVDKFGIGPISFSANQGEIIFVVGGNGSGKSTLVKLLTGLYEKDQGEILINGKSAGPDVLGEYFSVVHSPGYIFEKMYNTELNNNQKELEYYLKELHLDEKVRIDGDKYSTINLSNGQRKRLLLLQCYMENSPIYVFDEWAADQDPSYRKFFYMSLLPQMKKQGKIVIAITHDDHYFHVADKIFEMHQGSLKGYTEKELLQIFS